jgi:5,5'-dehydrodivanillate O-demethylase
MVSTGERPTSTATGEPEWADYIHTGPGTLAGRYLRRYWQPIYIASDLPAGRAIPIRIMGEDLTLYRGETTRVRPHPDPLPETRDAY